VERHFHEDLRLIVERLEAMGALVESRVQDAVSALDTQQASGAVRVLEGDPAINDLEVQIDDLCFKALALQHPVALDLRLIRSVMKATTDLERIGDEAVNIASAVVDLIGQPPLREQADVIVLGDRALSMLRSSLRAFIDRDVAHARLVLESEDQADDVSDHVLQELLSDMRTHPETVERAQGLSVITRSLERVADHATNLAEDLIFFVEGHDIRHGRNNVA
jgi:phosphate transport system protein